MGTVEGEGSGVRPVLVAERYELGAVIGSGATSSVHAALDRVTGAQVAVKLLDSGPIAISQRVRREVAALRLLRLPGVVSLLDDGVHRGAHFLVMDLVEGDPFPGAAAPAEWDGLAPLLLAFVETLARIHAAGVVHRDLKPSNVLVDAHGRVTVLDFGLSWGPALGAAVTAVGTVVGTPEYLSPEQLSGGHADVRSDLYALGVMLYELFAGALPHVASDFGQLAELKRATLPVPLRRVAPAVPRSVAAVVDRLLSIDPADRPRSAGETLDGLFGRGKVPAVEGELPRLGSPVPLERVLAAIRAGTSIDVTGPHGSGRTRLLTDAGRALESSERAVRWVLPGHSPFASLDALLGGFDDLSALSFDAARQSIRDRVGGLLRSGVTLLVDDLDRVDRWSVEILEATRAEGRVVRVTSRPAAEAVALDALPEEDLRPLFAGPDRIFHLREDGARELWRRTGGLPARVATEIAAWVRAGLAHWQGEELVLRRHTLDRLRGGLPVGDPQFLHPGTAGNLAPELDELLTWIALAWPGSQPAVLAAATGRPRWRIDPELEALEQAGVVCATPDGRIQPLVVPRALQSWPIEQRQAAHRALSAAMPSGTPQRVRHLAAAGETHEVVAEALLVAPSLTRDGQTPDAIVLLEQALSAARSIDDAAGEQRVLVELAKTSLHSAAPSAIDRVLYELGRARVRTPLLESVEGLLASTCLVRSGQAERAFEELARIPPYDDRELELWRHAQRFGAAQFLSVESEAAILEELDAWSAPLGVDHVAASVDGWRALHLLRCGKFDESANLNLAVAARSRLASGRWMALINAATALLETDRLDEAMSAADEARALGASVRNPRYEAQGEALLRCTRYRRAAPLVHDVGFVDAIAEVADRSLESEVALTEAAIAWRSGDAPAGRDLAARACHGFKEVGSDDWGMIARALGIACGDIPAAGDLARLRRGAEASHDPLTAVQILGLLALVAPDWAPALRAQARTRFGQAPADPTRRGEVLSYEEIMEGLRSEG